MLCCVVFYYLMLCHGFSCYAMRCSATIVTGKQWNLDRPPLVGYERIERPALDLKPQAQRIDPGKEERDLARSASI